MNEIGASAAELAERIQLRGPAGHIWVALISGIAPRSKEFSRFVSDISVLCKLPVRPISAARANMSLLVTMLHQPKRDIAVITGFDKWTPEHWKRLDINRSGFEREGPLILWLSEKAANQLCAFAPNIRSFVGSSIYQLTSDVSPMSAQEKTHRLAALRERYRMTDEEVIRQAEEKLLPSSSNFAEWLILLGRADLI
jgi:hypothetical protein